MNISEISIADVVTDGRVVMLATLLGASETETIGRVLRVWARCESQKTDELPYDEFSVAAGIPNFAGMLLEAGFLSEKDGLWRLRILIPSAERSKLSKSISRNQKRAGGRFGTVATVKNTVPTAEEKTDSPVHRSNGANNRTYGEKPVVSTVATAIRTVRTVNGESPSSPLPPPEVSPPALLFPPPLTPPPISSRPPHPNPLPTPHHPVPAHVENDGADPVDHERDLFGDASRPKPKKIRKSDEELRLPRAIWSAYEAEYFRRYGAEPVRNGVVNAQVAQLAKRLGEDAPEVVKFYVGHNKGFYVENTHSFRFCLMDAESLSTQWKTGRTVTRADLRNMEKNDHYESQMRRVREGTFNNGHL